MINSIDNIHEESDKNKKKSDSLLDYLKNDSVSYAIYEEIKSLLPDKLICEQKTMSSWDKKYTKRMLHKENDKALVDKLKSFAEEKWLIGNQLAFNSHFDYYYVRTVYTIN